MASAEKSEEPELKAPVQQSEEPELKVSVSEPVSSSPPQLTEPEHSIEQSSEPLQPTTAVSDDPNIHGVHIYPHTTEGVPQVETDVQETEEVLPDGTVVRRKLVTTSTQQTISTEMPPGSDDPNIHGVRISPRTTEGVPQVETDVKETEEVLPDGTVVRRKLVTTSTQQTISTEMPLEPVEYTAAEAAVPSESSVTQVVDLQEEPLDPDDPNTRGVRIYTDTTEGIPQVQRDVKETEEVLPDGTVVRRQVVTTSQRQTISTRVVMEGPEDILPASKAEAEQLLGEMGVSEELGRQIATTDSEPQASTNVEEHEEVLPDGSVVKRRVVTTTKQHVTTERVSLEDDDIPAGSSTTVG